MPRPSIASITERSSNFRWLPRSLRFKNTIWSPSRLRNCPPAHIVCLSNTEPTTRTIPRHWFLTTLSFRILPFRLSLQAPQTLQAPQAKLFTMQDCQNRRSSVSSLVPWSVLYSLYSVSLGSSKRTRTLFWPN